MSKHITSFSNKWIGLKDYGFFIQYNPNKDLLLIDSIKSPEELVQTKNMRCPFITIDGDIVYYYTVSTEHLLTPNGFRRRYISRRRFEKWIEQPFRDIKLSGVRDRIIFLAESYFDWELKIVFQDVTPI